MVSRIIQKIIDYIKSLRSEAMRYIAAGILTTLVNVSLFAFMTKVLKIAVTPANVTAVFISIIFAYLINKCYVFRRRSESKIALSIEFIKFVGSRLFTMALEIGAVWLIVLEMGFEEMFGKLVAQVFVVIGNYIISKAVVFRK